MAHRLRRAISLVLLILIFAGTSVGQVRAIDLPALDDLTSQPVRDDWLVTRIARRAGVYRGGRDDEIVMSNGLIRRTFRLAPNAATVAFDNLITGHSILRGVKPEAVVELDGKRFDIGGLAGQPDYAYLKPEWLDQMTADPAAFAFTGFEVGPITQRFAWKRKRHAADAPWPPLGVALTLHFKAPPGGPGVNVAVHYEIYDGIPLLAKWITIHNGGGREIRVNSFKSEVLAVVEHESAVDDRTAWANPDLHVESDYAFHGMDPATANRTAHWMADPQYLTQVNFERRTPCLLESAPPIGPDAAIRPGGDFESFRTFELPFDSSDRERNGLAIRRMYRTIAPWVTENPVLMHVTRSDPNAVRLAIDQCADVGFEMLIMSFGSGFNIENEDPAYIAQVKHLVEYANSKGVELGGYSLLASRGDAGPQNEVIDPKTHRPGGAIFGNSPCLGSAWGQAYFRKLYAFCKATGLNVIEHDGSYPGDLCAATDHPGHRGLNDSQWTQWRTISGFYNWCRREGIYLNVPDFYFLNGSNKVGMGYREDNWSLPRDQQIIHGRQNIFDGTWEKTPSMGWMFVPLTQYHGGGAAATIEPLSQHLDAYEAHLANNFGAGVQACYRGPRLYDTEQTRLLVKKWVDFYKQHRAILDSDIIHVRRADGRDIDCMLHVNPALTIKALAMVYNPLDTPVHRTVTVPLYYSGLTAAARVRERGGAERRFNLDRQFRIEVPIDIEAHGVTWLEIE